MIFLSLLACRRYREEKRMWVYRLFSLVFIFTHRLWLGYAHHTLLFFCWYLSVFIFLLCSCWYFSVIIFLCLSHTCRHTMVALRCHLIILWNAFLLYSYNFRAYEWIICFDVLKSQTCRLLFLYKYEAKLINWVTLGSFWPSCWVFHLFQRWKCITW